MFILIFLKIEEKQGKSQRLNGMFSCAYVKWKEGYERNYKLNKKYLSKKYFIYFS